MARRPSNPIMYRPTFERTRIATVTAGLLLSACGKAPVATPPAPVSATPVEDVMPASGTELLARMRARYAGKWFKTLSFLQHNTSYLASGREVASQWMEYVRAPGAMRIDFLPASGTGLLTLDGRTYEFANGKQIRTTSSVNPLLLLTADVYTAPSDSVAAALVREGFSLSLVRETRVNARRIWIVGALAGDTTHSQFWVDADRLLVTRVIQRQRVQGPTGTTRETVSDVKLRKYVDFDGVPIATDIVQQRDGRLVFREEFAEVKVNPQLDDALFDPAKWK